MPFADVGGNARVRVKYSYTAGERPAPGELRPGELALNVPDRLLYFAGGGGTVEYISGTKVFSDADTVNLFSNTNGTGIITDAGDAFLAGEVRAARQDDDTLSLISAFNGKIIYQNIQFANIFIGGRPASAIDAFDAANQLNSFLIDGGSSYGQAPDLSSVPSSVDVIVGQQVSVNFSLDPAKPLASEFEWQNTLDAQMAVSHNYRGVLFVFPTSPFAQAVTLKAWNSFGVSEKVITINALAPAPLGFPGLQNTESFRPTPTVYLRGSGTEITDTFEGNDFSVSCWIKAPTSSGNLTFWAIGDGTKAKEDRLDVAVVGGPDEHRVRIRVGKGNSSNYFSAVTGANTIVPGTWQHVMVVADGNKSNTDKDDFKVYVDGVLTPTVTEESKGTASMPHGADMLFHVGRCMSGSTTFNGGLVDEVAVWGSSQAANIAAIYNGGAAHDLSTLGTPPTHWWRCGDKVVALPTIPDQIGTSDLTLVNGDTASFVADVV